MSKRPTHDAEMKELIDHLGKQDDQLQEILIILRGSISLGVDGIVDKQKDFEQKLLKLIGEVAHYERWRQKQISDRGKITISIPHMFTRIMAVIGGLGTVAAAILALKELFGK